MGSLTVRSRLSAEAPVGSATHGGVFVNEGARVVIAGRRQEEAKRLPLNSARLPVSLELMFPLSMTWPHDSNMPWTFWPAGLLVQQCRRHVGGGIGIADIDMQRFNAAMAVHVGGAVLGMKHAAPIMMRQQCGSIINTASVNGTRAGYTTLTYCTAKAAVIHLTKCVAVELGPYGVRVNSLSPVRLSPVYSARRLASIPTWRIATPKRRGQLSELLSQRSSRCAEWPHLTTLLKSFCSLPAMHPDALPPTTCSSMEG